VGGWLVRGASSTTVSWVPPPALRREPFNLSSKGLLMQNLAERRPCWKKDLIDPGL